MPSLSTLRQVEAPCLSAAPAGASPDATLAAMGWTSEFRTSTARRSGALMAAALNPAANPPAGGVARARGRPAWRSTFGGTSKVWGVLGGAQAALEEAAFLSAASARPSRVANCASAALRSSRLKTWPSGYQAVQKSVDAWCSYILKPPPGMTANVSD